MSQMNFNFLLKNMRSIDKLKDLTLVRGYHQIFEQYPSLHPDGFDDYESGWPKELRPICAEMWRRVSVPESKVTLENMYYTNKWFRQLATESQRRARHC